MSHTPIDSSDESQTSEESDIDSETSSALFMAVSGVKASCHPWWGGLGGSPEPPPTPPRPPPEEEDPPQAGAEGLSQQLTGQQPAGDADGARQHQLYPPCRCLQAGARWGPGGGPGTAWGGSRCPGTAAGAAPGGLWQICGVLGQLQTSLRGLGGSLGQLQTPPRAAPYTSGQL